jgi:D-galactarolactone cycloisomerase
VSSKVANVEVLTLQHPVAVPTGPAAVTYYQRECVVVRVEDGDGVVGWGETYVAPGLAAVARELGTTLLGRDPNLARGTLDALFETGVDTMAISAWAIALDDLRGRQLGVPISQLYGGARRTSVQAYASSGGYRDDIGPEESWFSDVRSAVDDGFLACKLRIGRFHPRRELPILERVRAETDDQIDLMVDANGAYSLPLAIEVGRKLEELKFRWFEEPLIRGRSGMNYPGYEGLARLDIPIAAAEGLQNRSAFHHILNRGGVDIIQPDVAICGGIGEAAFIAELAALHGKPCVPHAWGGAILLAATLQLVSLIPEPSEVVGPSSPLLEFDRFENRMRTEVSVTPISVVDGFVAIPSAPGLGIEIDETALRSFIHSPEE